MQGQPHSPSLDEGIRHIRPTLITTDEGGCCSPGSVANLDEGKSKTLVLCLRLQKFEVKRNLNSVLGPRSTNLTATLPAHIALPYLPTPWKDARQPCTEVWSACLYEVRGVSCL